MNQELTHLNSYKIIDLDLSDFNETFNEFSNSIDKATEAAENAKKSAESAKNRSAGFGKKKVAIEELQLTVVDLVKAVQEITEVQKVSFDFQKQLAKILKNLFKLCISNIFSNRHVVEELEMRLKGASQNELSESERQTIMKLVMQLKKREDIFKKVDDILQELKNYDDILKVQSQKIRKIGEKLHVQEDINKKYEEKLKKQTEAEQKFEEKFQAQAEAIKQHNNDLNQKIENNLKTIEERKTEIQLLKDEMIHLKVLLDSKTNDVLLRITFIITIVTFVMSIIHFFI